jgi:hypothetical protein
VVQAAWGESYFDPDEMQQETPRYRTLVEALPRHWGEEVADLFQRAWRSETLADCPTFGEWLVALPEHPVEQAFSLSPAGESTLPIQDSPSVETTAEIRAFMQAARRMEDKGNLEGALELYRQALELAQADPSLRSLAREIELSIQDVQKRHEAEERAKREAEERARREVEERARREAEKAARREAEERIRRQAKEKARPLPWLWLGVAGLVLLLAGWGLTQLWQPTPRPTPAVVGQVVTQPPPIVSPTQAITVPPTATPLPPTATPTSMPATRTSTPSPTPTPYVEVQAEVLNVRQGPGTVYDVLGKLHKGDRLKLLARNEGGDWLQVCCVDGKEGWVAKELVTAYEPAGGLAVARNIPPTPTPSAPAARGRIAFASDRDGNFEIYVMNADGSGVTRLTNNPADDRFPSWSPDGKRIAFTSDRDGNREIYVMNADGSGVTRLTNSPAPDGVPSWSPDGKRIAFDSERDGNREIYVMNADGSGVTRLTNNPSIDGGPSWSPDGRRIAFASDRDGNFEIYVMNADGSGVTRLTNSPGDDWTPSWSPDGRRIAFTSNRDGGWYNWEIYVINVDGSGETNLTNESYLQVWPSWSPDGRRIAFASNRYGWEIYVMNADGSGVTRLTSNPGQDPSWSPVP